MINEHYLGAKFKTGKTIRHGLETYFIEIISDEGELLSYHTFMSKGAVLNKLREIRYELQHLAQKAKISETNK